MYKITFHSLTIGRRTNGCGLFGVFVTLLVVGVLYLNKRFDLGIRQQHPSTERPPLGWRILLNCKHDKIFYKPGMNKNGNLILSDPRKHAYLKPAAEAVNNNLEFSKRILENQLEL